MILQNLNKTITELKSDFDLIQPERKLLLAVLTKFIKTKTQTDQPVYLNFICTHNSRRSQLSQLWAQTAANYYGIKNVECFSGGTEVTAFNPRAVKAMAEAGFDISIWKTGSNPIYNVKFSDHEPAVRVYSKKYNDSLNPTRDFAAIMTCTHADQNCPVVSGALKRIALTYDDPRDFDGTPQESEEYAARVREIGREILYAFSQVK